MDRIDLVGEDRIVKRDVTSTGLHRLHVMRLGDWPDDLRWEAKIPVAVLERKTKHWYQSGNEFHLYLTWPTPEPAEEYWQK